MSGRFLVYEDRAGNWRFRLLDSRGALVAVGEAHATRDEAIQKCREVQDAAKDAEVIHVDQNGEPR